MKSTLIRFTDSKYADNYMAGELYMSSLSKFWDLQRGRINYYDSINGKVSEEEQKQALEFQEMRQQDFSEGVASQIPWDKLPDDIKAAFDGHIIHDARFRVEAYGYCNLLCFYRVDAVDTENGIFLDEDILSYLLEQNGVNISADKIRTMDQFQLREIFSEVIPQNFLLSDIMCHMVQLPGLNMDRYGDMVVLIKDEEEFVKRVAEAVKNQGGEFIAGDVKYHEIKDRVHPDDYRDKHHVTVFTGGGYNDGLFDMGEMLDNNNQVIWYGCLDKYDMFKDQKEWRVCWMPEVKNNRDKILHVGNLKDIIEIVPKNNIRRRLLEEYSGYIPGIIEKVGRYIDGGTMTYPQFKQFVESIDGKCRIMIDIG